MCRSLLPGDSRVASLLRMTYGTGDCFARSQRLAEGTSAHAPSRRYSSPILIVAASGVAGRMRGRRLGVTTRVPTSIRSRLVGLGGLPYQHNLCRLGFGTSRHNEVHPRFLIPAPLDGSLSQRRLYLINLAAGRVID